MANSSVKLNDLFFMNSNMMDHGGEKKKNSSVLFFRLWVLFPEKKMFSVFPCILYMQLFHVKNLTI